jgi:hypothetical protein
MCPPVQLEGANFPTYSGLTMFDGTLRVADSLPGFSNPVLASRGMYKVYFYGNEFE